MKSVLQRLSILFCALSITNVSNAQLPVAPALATSNVTEAAQYGVLYELSIPATANYSTLGSILYTVNNSGLTLNYNRIAYFLQIDSKWVWVSMSKFNSTNAQLSVPYANSGIIYQQTVSAMNVYGSAASGVTNATNIAGNIEIWPDCYGTAAGLGGIGGNGGNYDFNDSRQAATNCYGSFQVHNFNASQTIFAFNNFMGGTVDLGIGNNVANGNPDWTFMNNGATYTTRKLYILVQNGITFQTQPSSTAKNACLNGTLAALTVSAAVNSGTITNYQWYSVSTATNSGGSLVATHTTSLTTDTYTPSTSTAGSLFYYCVANGSGAFTATSSVSGMHTVTNPTLSVSGSGSLCAGSSISLSVNSAFSFTAFSWSSGGSASSVLLSPASTNAYSVTGTTSIGCVAVSSPVTVTVNAIPVISVANGTICNGSSFMFTPSGAVTYTYSGGTANVSPATTTNYTISGTSAEGCVGTNTEVSVTVNNLPVVSITGTTEICSGSTASLSANGAASYTWSSGSNATSVSVSPTITTSYSLSGSSAEGCTSASVAVVTLTVYNLPVLSISGANTVCAGSSVELTAAGALFYSWNTAATSASISVTPTGTSTYSVSGMDSKGCISSNSAIATVSVYNLPVLSLSSSTSICAGSSANLIVSGANTYTWNTSSNAATITVSPALTSSYSVIGTSAEGCVSAIPALSTVSVNVLPVVSISGTTGICSGNSVSLTASGANTYTWNTGSNASNASFNPTTTTTYSVMGTSTAGCISATAAIQTVTVFALPTISISGSNTLCLGSSAAITANGAATYTWNTGANTTLISVSPTTTTNYSVTGTSTDGCISAAAAVSGITVFALPTVSISGSSSLCAGASINLSVAGASTYTWNTNANGNSISVSPATSTMFTVLGTSSVGCVSANSASQSVNVFALPSLSITSVQNTICAGQSIGLAAAGAATYTWQGLGNLASITVTPGATTSYSLNGLSAQGCAGSQVVKTISVIALPTVVITGTNAICSGNTATLAASGASTYSWNGLGTGTTIAVTPSVTSFYSVSGTSTLGCSQTSTYTVTVNQLPAVTIGGTSGLCTGQSATLTATGATSYSWNTGATTATIITTPTASTIYTVTGTDVFGCIKTNTQLVSVAANLSVTIAGPTVICAGDSITLNANGASNYIWSTTETTQSISLTPNVTTSYSVIGVTGSCSNTAVTTVSVNATPSVTIIGTNTVCSSESITLSVSGADSYTWASGSTNSLIVVSPTISTLYTVLGQYANGCSSFSQLNVAVYGLPVVSVSGNSLLCLGDTTQLAALGAGTYTWSTGSNATSITLTPSTSTAYFVVGTDANGCKDSSAVVMVTVNPIPSLNVASTAGALCIGQSVTFTVSGADFYLWDNNSTSNVVSFTPTISSSYTVTGTNTFACSSSTVINLAVNALPSITVVGPTKICKNETAKFIVGGANTYTWNTGFQGDTLVVTPNTTTSYSVNGISLQGCENSASVQLTVSTCAGLSEFKQRPVMRMYPNPSSNKITIEIAETENAVIIIHNVLGQVVLIEKALSVTQLNLEQLAKGMYYVSISKSNNVLQTETLIKE